MNAHKIKEQFLWDKPVFAQIADDLVAFIGDGCLIVHNAVFDMSFLNGELMRAGRTPLTNTVIDTLRLARQKFPRQPAKIEDLCRRFGIASSEYVLHGALSDARCLARLYPLLVGDTKTVIAHPYSRFEELLEYV